MAGSFLKYTTMIKPLKRHPALVPLSKDHHFGLLLCWKIRTGAKTGVAPGRIAAYVEYFYEHHLKQHFQEEEEYIFSLLGANDEKRKKAEQQHRRINRLVEKLALIPERRDVTLGQLEEELEAHIRFEERELFPYLQNILSSRELEELQARIDDIHVVETDTWEDQFWVKEN